MLNQPIDIREEFYKAQTQYFIANKLLDFDVKTAQGNVLFDRHARKIRFAFNDGRMPFEKSDAWEFPPDYQQDLSVRFQLEFVSDRTVRILMKSKEMTAQRSVVINDTFNEAWNCEEKDGEIQYHSKHMKIKISKDPFHITVLDEKEKVLFTTNHIMDTMCLQNADPMPLCIARNTDNMSRYFANSLSLMPNEMIFGGGESFTRLNKRGQKMVLYAKDPHGVQTAHMYKPIPFLMSNRGYGLFYNTTTPLTFDVGYGSDLANVAYIGESTLDLFVFAGEPKELLREYTALTGRSPMPPLWSFGLWMSKISYSSQGEVEDVAKKLREYRIPCDVIHIDTGWFEENWRCDYQFSKTRFENPQKMLADLRKNGFRVSLWQYPYITPKNKLYEEIMANGYAIKDGEGNSPVEDAVIDFSNEEAVKWYQNKLKQLFDMGVSAIKVDFGEAAPVNGQYASGKSGFFEHNLYPYRYNKAVFEVTKEATGDSIIWARSAWAGSQKYPLHWGGDCDNTNGGMAASLRGGLSLGLCGFSFWSHDIGGFVKKSPRELYRRWLTFGMLSSHSRCHGAPPKEPWGYDDEFVEIFRKNVELKYSLLPYIIEQSKICCENGFPLLRTLFFEFPHDAGSWYIEDEYMLGENILVAPIFEDNRYDRDLYLPTGDWVDYFTQKRYVGGQWHNISVKDFGAVILVRHGSEIPHIPVYQCTDEMDFDEIYVKKY